MATKPKPSKNVKVDLFEDDDEFEEFEINEECKGKEEGKEVWKMVQKWLGVYTAFPSNTFDHFEQFGSAAGYAKSRKSFMYMIWLATFWVI
ncbi:hypothetical protein MTR_4g105790 [Medicago truncatula]|uniref:Uncharacterized protein n=1 Tax=Medicago truncatula TaxID=3880 RepID=A0A072UQC4_MEDTR|nr:hypothetical protein MTR_4g105790 [Medicago truncatula]